MENNILYDATTVATSHERNEIEYELKRRYCIKNNIRSALYTVSDETLTIALSIYDNPELKSERDTIKENFNTYNIKEKELVPTQFNLSIELRDCIEQFLNENPNTNADELMNTLIFEVLNMHQLI